jgi:peptide/nickel transport system permease protein
MSGPAIGTVLRRTVARAAPTLFGVIILSFFLLKLAPGDAADVIAAESGSPTTETIAVLRQRLGLGNSVLTQFLDYLNSLAHLSLGYSARYNMPVLDLIWRRLPSTLLLVITALAIAIALGIWLGATMSAFAGKVPDRLISLFSLLIYSMPGFWLGLMLTLVFSVKLGWLPSGGSNTIGSGLTGLPAIFDALRYLVLPATSLAMVYVAIYARLTRATMIEIMSQDYVRTAAAKGLSPRAIIWRHVLPNALIPLTTMAGVHVGAMLGGAVVIETVYSWPGLGRLAFEAVMTRDFSVLLGILLLSSLLVVTVNAAVDLLQAWLDPRIRQRQ